MVDSEQQWLMKCLSATLDTDQQLRSFAETSLSQASLQPGFGSALVKVAANRDIPLGLRQLAAVLLKQFVKRHWQEDEENFEHPLASSEEKTVIRGILLLSLGDSHKKMCTAIGMAVASIAHYDWPEEWPQLLPHLLKLINDQSNINGVHGGLRCLALLSGDLDDTVVPTLVPILFPCLHTIVSSPQIYDKNLRAKALSIVYSCSSILGTMSGVYKTETGALFNPMIPIWMDQFSKILENPVQSEDPDDWCIRMEVLKCLNQFVQNFPSLTDMQFMVIAGPLWKTFISSLKVYEQSSVEGTDDSFEGRYDSDGAEQSLESFVIQMFEFFLTVVGTTKLAKVLANNIKELAYYTIAFLQITEQQVHTWSIDANQYVADEDETTYSCRVSGTLLLEEVINSCGTNAIEAIIVAARERFSESQQAKVAGSASWWRMREAILFALASLSDQLLEVEDSGQVVAAIGNLLEQMITEDIGTGMHEYPFLYARLFSSIPKFSSVINRGVVEHILYSAIKAIETDVPPPVKVGACRAVSELLPEANKGTLQSHMLGLFSSLADLLNQASDETMHLVLETMQAAIKSGHEAAASIEPIISPIILNVWGSHVSDPFISIDAVEVLEAIKNVPGCVHPLVCRVLPHIGPVLSKPQQQPAGLVSGALDLVTMLLKNTPIDVAKAVYDTCFDSVVRIVLQSDDHSEMQNGTECLAMLLYVANQEVLSWGADPGFVMRSLLDVASRLLDPALESSGSLFVGSYILQLILHLPSQMAPHIRDLVAALTRRMNSSPHAVLRSSLILIFARLVHMSAPHVEQFIDLMISLPAQGYPNSFVYLMSEWTKQQGEIQGSYQIKVTTTALVLLLSTRHAELGNVNVQGHLIKSAPGITTRSKAKSAPDQWTSISLPSKVLALLAEALIEMQEQILYDNDDEDSDWEEIQAGDTEADQDLLYSGANSSCKKPSNEYLERMAKVIDEDEDDMEGDELLNNADPLNMINLGNYILEFLRNFSHKDRSLFDHLCQSLTKAQLNSIQMALSQ